MSRIFILVGDALLLAVGLLVAVLLPSRGGLGGSGEAGPPPAPPPDKG